MIFQDNAWGEFKMGKFIPLYTDEEWQFRLKAVECLESGTMAPHEVLKLQQECVKMRAASPYSQSKKEHV